MARFSFYSIWLGPSSNSEEWPSSSSPSDSTYSPWINEQRPLFSTPFFNISAIFYMTLTICSFLHSNISFKSWSYAPGINFLNCTKAKAWMDELATLQETMQEQLDSLSNDNSIHPQTWQWVCSLSLASCPFVSGFCCGSVWVRFRSQVVPGSRDLPGIQIWRHCIGVAILFVSRISTCIRSSQKACLIVGIYNLFA